MENTKNYIIILVLGAILLFFCIMLCTLTDTSEPENRKEKSKKNKNEDGAKRPKRRFNPRQIPEDIKSGGIAITETAEKLAKQFFASKFIFLFLVILFALYIIQKGKMNTNAVFGCTLLGVVLHDIAAEQSPVRFFFLTLAILSVAFNGATLVLIVLNILAGIAFTSMTDSLFVVAVSVFFCFSFFLLCKAISYFHIGHTENEKNVKRIEKIWSILKNTASGISEMLASLQLIMSGVIALSQHIPELNGIINIFKNLFRSL